MIDREREEGEKGKKFKYHGYLFLPPRISFLKGHLKQSRI